MSCGLVEDLAKISQLNLLLKQCVTRDLHFRHISFMLNDVRMRVKLAVDYWDHVIVRTSRTSADTAGFHRKSLRQPAM